MIEPSTQPGELLTIGDQVIRFDRVCTIEAYRKVDKSWAKQCDCLFCRNFAPQRATVYPQSFLDLLHRVGIDPGKEGEVYDLGPAPSGKRLYGGWFFLCGQLAKRGEAQASIDGISYWLQGPGDMPSPSPSDAFDPDPLALNFTLEVPWVLTGEDPEEPYRTS
jgi:hypothetical protein